MEVRSIEAIIKALNDAGVKYLIVGGVTVNAHGFIRLTRELDLVLGLERDNILPGLRVLAQADYRLAIPEPAANFADESIRARWRQEKT
jgi:hypothetical protein